MALFFFSLGLTLVLLSVTYLSYGISGYIEGYSFLIIGIFLLVLFVKQESRIEFPMLDLKLFKIKQFAMGNVSQLLNSLSWTGAVLLSAFYLQIGLGYTPLQGGLGLLPLDVAYLFFSFASGRLADKYESRGLATLGLAITTVCFFVMSAFGESTPYLEIALVFVFMGVGNGLFLSPNMLSIMGVVPANRIGIVWIQTDYIPSGLCYKLWSRHTFHHIRYPLLLIFVSASGNRYANCSFHR